MSAWIPAWVGWPGTGPAPGRDWLPGPALRFTILLLAYAFLALALTVNYAYSVTFFLLAIIGMYVGLRRGFINGLTPGEKLVMVAFATYPTVAIISYLLGTQTNIGFRFLGRDLRFLLFVPVYLSLRWSGLRARHVGAALGLGAAGALIAAIVQLHPHNSSVPLPHGTAGTHISFGDLALVGGFLSAIFLLEARGRATRWLMVGGVVICGVCVSALSGARGGWPAGVLLSGLLVYAVGRQATRWRLGAVAIVCTATVAILALVIDPTIRVRTGRAFSQAAAFVWLWRNSDGRAFVDRACPNSPAFMKAFLSAMEVEPPQYRGSLRVVRDKSVSAVKLGKQRCMSDYVYKVQVPADVGSVWVGIPRYRSRTNRLREGIVARGTGIVAVGRIASVQVNSPDRYLPYELRASEHGASQPLFVRVLRGRSMRFVPLQLRAGEYVWPLATSPVGSRMLMWMAAWKAFLAQPILGHGAGSFPDVLRHARYGDIGWPAAGLYQHPHDEILNALCSAGVVGLIVLLILYATPIWLGRFTRDRATRTALYALSASFFVFGVSETMFIHSLVISSWVVLVASLTVLSNTTTTASSSV